MFTLTIQVETITNKVTTTLKKVEKMQIWLINIFNNFPIFK